MSAAFVLLLVAVAPQADLAPIDDILRSVPDQAGVCVVVGGADGALAVRLAEGRKRLVHGLLADEAGVDAVRRIVESRGLSGQVSVEAWSHSWLPYGDDLINLLVAEEPGTVPEREMLRVLAPNGAAWVRRDGAWKMTRKPSPKEFDEWTHWRHGADGNMVSRDRAVDVPTGLRWVAGSAQDAAGKKWYYDHVLICANGRNFYVYEDSISARDAHNGALLWTRPLKAHAFKETGTPLPPDAPQTPRYRVGVRVSKVRPVAVGDQIFAASEGKVLLIDARTGETRVEIGTVDNPREILVDGGYLLVSAQRAVHAYDVATGKPAWETALEARRIVAGDGGVFAVTSTHVVGLDRATGRELWRTEDPDARLVLTCTYHDGVLVLEKSTLRDDAAGCGIRVYSTKGGELLWTRNYTPDMTHYREARAYFARGLLWIQQEKDTLLGLAPKNGSEREQLKSRGKHCATPVATERFFIAPECEFTDFATGAQSRSRMFKAACRLPFIPAYGLLYTFPVQCECYPMLRGYMGLSSGKPAEIAAAPRHQAGSAVPAPAALLKPADAEAEWPTYRHDVFRSGSTPAPLGRADLKRAWESPVAPPSTVEDWKGNPFVRGILSPPVAAAGSVFVAVPDLHRVTAFDSADGRPRWSFTAGGRVDGPPTIYDGLCLFGCHDGWVYCLRAADGALVWRFRAAPREARMLAYGQMESPWPVVGSVLVDRDAAYVAAGRHPAADGGLRVLALHPRTGRLLWEKVIDSLDEITRWYGGTLASRVKIGLDFEPIDMLVRDGDVVSMSRWRFNPADGDFKLALDSTQYKAFGGLAVSRGLWGYGIRQTKMVQLKPAAAFDATGIRKADTGDVAMILAGGTPVTVSAKGLVKHGDRTLDLGSEPIYDGLISAYGRLYVSTHKGTLVCLE